MYEWQVGSEGLKASMTYWLTTQCEFNFLLADKLRDSTEESFPAFLPLQARPHCTLITP